MSQKRRFICYPKQRNWRDFDPENLMVEAKKGEGGAFDALYRLYLTPVLRYLYARTWNREIAEDVSQITFLKAYAGLSGWCNQGKHPLAYFFTIARNALADYWSGERHIAIIDAGCKEIADTQISPEMMLVNSQLCEILKCAVDDLTKNQREVIAMRYFSELDYAEISETTGKSEESVRQSHSRALKALRIKLKGISATSHTLTMHNCGSPKRRCDVSMRLKTILCRNRKPCSRL